MTSQTTEARRDNSTEFLAPAPDTLIERARSMVPALVDRREACRTKRQVPQETLTELQEMGLPRIVAPRSHGG